MGTDYNGDRSSGGIIPKVMETIFKRVETMKNSTEFCIRVSFIEVSYSVICYGIFLLSSIEINILRLELLKNYRYSRKRFMICLIPMFLKEK